MIKVGDIVETSDCRRGKVFKIYWYATAGASFCAIRSVDIVFQDNEYKNFDYTSVKLV